MVFAKFEMDVADVDSTHESHVAVVLDFGRVWSVAVCRWCLKGSCCITAG